MRKIALVDLKAQFESIRGEVLEAVTRVLDSQSFILGPNVRELENEVAALCGVPHAVGCASGSDALILALAACGTRDGGEVVTSPFSFFASAGSIVHAGGRPAFCDIEPKTFCMDPQKLEQAITPRTRAIMPVHLFGQCADMDPITAAAGRSGAAIIEDGAQAIGATEAGSDGRGTVRAVGAFGDTGCLSFFPTKNLGGAGDGGMVVTRDESIAGKLRLLRTHGGRKMYHHAEVGWNSRLDEIQAAVLRVKLRRLSSWSEARAHRAAIYDELLSEAGLVSRELLTLPYRRPGATHIFHQYTVRAVRRDELREHLASEGISSGIYYPVPLHLQECFRFLDHGRGDFPEAEKASEEVLSLPIYPELDRESQATVVREIAAYYGL